MVSLIHYDVTYRTTSSLQTVDQSDDTMVISNTTKLYDLLSLIRALSISSNILSYSTMAQKPATNESITIATDATTPPDVPPV